MLRLFLLFLFIALPLWVLLVRHVLRCRQAQVKDMPKPRVSRDEWVKALLLTALLAVTLGLLTGLSHSRTDDGYRPPHSENGHIVPGQVAP